MELQESQRRAIMQQYPGFYRLTAVVILIGIGIFIGWILFADKDGYGMNLFTEFVGIGFTYLIVDWLVRQRDETQAKEKLKDELLDDFRSDVNHVAKHAVNKLRRYGWLFDGSLKNLNFYGANLAGAELGSANLKGVNLHHAMLEKAVINNVNLEMADLEKTNLRDAILRNSNLAGCDIGNSDLQNADLRRANLLWASLYRANLEGANMGGAFLLGADLRGANLKAVNLWDADIASIDIDSETQFDINTILPDGSHWRNINDLERFVEGHWKPTKHRAPSNSQEVKPIF